MPEGRTRGLAAVWFADIVGYTTLSEQDEDRALRLVAQLQAVTEKEVAARSGRIVKYMGDAALVVFDSAGMAVEAALAVREGFQNSALALESGTSLRIGIHVGEIAIAADGDVYGDGVNTASRIQGAAAPGQILLSSFAAESIRQRPDFQTVALGEDRVKGLSRPLELFSVGWKGAEGDTDGQPMLPVAKGRRLDFFSELKRRKVYRAGVVYLAAAFGVLEGADLTFPALGLGSGIFNGLVLASLLGFPLAMILAWTFDVSDGGIRRTVPATEETASGALDSSARVKAALMGAGFVAVIWLGMSLWQPMTPADSAGIPVDGPVLAVLPFEDFSPEGDQAYFADGLHEELLHQLAMVRGIRLISRTSVSHFREREEGITAIADSLGADYILEGSVRRFADSVQLTAQLIDGSNDQHLWSISPKRALGLAGLFDLQEVLATRVARSLGGTLGAGTGQTIGVAPTSSLDAYHAYLRGLHRWAEFSMESIEASLVEFNRAIALDPEFGRAHGKLAIIYSVLNNFGMRVQGELFPLMREHAEKAMRYAPDDPGSHFAMVAIHWPQEWDWEAAREDLERALALDPDYADARWALAEWYGVIEGNTERGLEIIQEAERLDPFSLQPPTVRAWILMCGGRHEEAIQEYRQLMALAPNDPSHVFALSLILTQVGQEEEARQILNGLFPHIPSPRPVNLAGYLAGVGEEEKAREVLADALALKEAGGGVAASGVAMAYAALGETDEALNWLELSFDQEGGVYYLRSPVWDPIRDHPRFQAIWERLGLPGVAPEGPPPG